MWWLLACAAPLDLPEDPAATGVPVGVRTVVHDGVRLEVWYPATDDVTGDAGEAVAVDEFVPAAFTEHVGAVALGPLPSIAVRDAPARRGTFPALLFSHGFGGMRVQSVGLTAHLASRGYVVVAPDHPGRMLGDVLPCVFSPSLDGCALAVSDDPGPDGLRAGLGWLEALPDDDPLQGRVDLERVGLFGHSAGGQSVGTLGQEDERFDALLTLAMGPTVDRDVPYAAMAATCDGIVPEDRVREGAFASGAELVLLPAAGHLAFSDMCDVGIDRLAELLEPRDDLNDIYFKSLVAFGTDGCPSAHPDPQTCETTEYGDLSESSTTVRAVATRFFDDALLERGPGLADLAE